MSVVVVTGAAGLIGSEAVEHFVAQGMDVVGIDNDMRRTFFGDEASTRWNRERLERTLGGAYTHLDLDIRDRGGIEKLYSRLAKQITAIIHCAAQPSHDWAASNPHVDFDVNAVGTLNLLEATRIHCPEARFVFMSTNKVYGDTPNRLPLVELPTRWEIEPGHAYESGIREDMSVDYTLHSLFGASKLAADVLVQEYGRYFGMATACFRGGTLTGSRHAATQLHGFLAFVMRCTMTATQYTVFGYGGKQVRDVIHSRDVLSAIDAVLADPRPGEIYNLGGGRVSNISVLESIELCEGIAGRALDWKYEEQNRVGDHIWWISDMRKFQSHYPSWTLEYELKRIAEEIYEENRERWR
ncbi:NAD-dependent epimerase/dehydratase family protein [soil metagenome]